MRTKSELFKKESTVCMIDVGTMYQLVKGNRETRSEVWVSLGGRGKYMDFLCRKDLRIPRRNVRFKICSE